MKSLSEIEDKDVGLLLSGGSGSAAVLFGLLELGKNVTAYTFHMEDVESTDLIKARNLAGRFGVKFVPVPLPSDLGTVKKDCLYLINEVGCRLKTDVECAFPIRHTLPLVKEKVLTSGLGDDNFFGLSKKALFNYKHSVPLLDEYRKEAYVKYDVQLNFFKAMGEAEGVAVHSPYQSKDMLKVFLGKSWEELNKPKIKQIILDAFPEEFEDLRTYHANYQKGDSGISDNFLQLLDSDWNLRNYKRTDGIFNSIARGEIRG